MSIGSRYVSSDPARAEVLTRAPLVDALLATYHTDQHVYLYVDPDSATTPRHSDEHQHPRLDALRIDTLIADVDNPGHARWSDDATAIAAAERALQLAETAAVYVTSAGLRIVQPLLHALPVLEADGAMRAWGAELERRGIAVDHSCEQWTRCFRLPHVRRNRTPYRSPLVDYSRMRPIAAPAGAFVRRASSRGGPLVELALEQDLPASWVALAAELRPVVAAEPWGVADGWHRLALRLAGAVLQLGLRPELASAFVLAAFPEPMPARDAARAAHDTARRYASRREIQGLRSLADAHPRVHAVLRPPVRATLPAQLPPAAEASSALLEDLRQVRPGLRLIAAACGTGKTRAARLVAAERAASGERTVISVPTHELALQITADLRAAGVEVRRAFGPLSVRLPDGSPACQFHVAASRLAVGRQSVRATLCEAPCEHRDGCAARDSEDGPSSARVVVGPHALLRGLVAEARGEGLLILDEPPPLTEQVVLRAERLSEVESYAERFEPRYMDAVLPSVRLVGHWLGLARMGVVHHLGEAFELEVDARPAREALEQALVGHEPPPLLGSAVRRCKADRALAETLGRVSRTLDIVRRAMLSSETRARVEPAQGDPQHRQLALTLLREDLALALRRDGPTVVAAADVELHARGYELVSSTSPPLTRYAAGDGSPIERVHLRMRATRTHWLPAPEALTGPAYRALELALLWLRERPWTRAGLVTYQALEQRLRGAWARLLPPGLEVRHYGELRGLDAWSTYDAFITLGDPYPPTDHVERDLLLLDLPAGEAATRERSMLLAAAELEQAHGRMRAPHRTTPARALHVGHVLPAGWAGHRTAEGAEGVITPAEVARLVADQGGPRAVGRLLGKSHVAVMRWASGERRCPPDVAEWLRAQAPPIRPCSVSPPGSHLVAGSASMPGTDPLVTIYYEGAGTSAYEGAGTSDPDDPGEAA